MPGRLVLLKPGGGLEVDRGSCIDPGRCLQLTPHEAVPGEPTLVLSGQWKARQPARGARQVVIMRIRLVPADALTVYVRGVSLRVGWQVDRGA